MFQCALVRFDLWGSEVIEKVGASQSVQLFSEDVDRFFFLLREKSLDFKDLSMLFMK